jgi:hypothetical protein
VGNLPAAVLRRRCGRRRRGSRNHRVLIKFLRSRDVDVYGRRRVARTSIQRRSRSRRRSNRTTVVLIEFIREDLCSSQSLRRRDPCE